MNEKSVIEKFIYDSREYITKSSIDNILTEIGQNDFNDLSCLSCYPYLMYLSKEYNTYLAMKIKVMINSFTLLRFPNISQLAIQKEIPLNNLPKIIADQIITTTVKLSLL